jgi:putative FmdB family regulatory protein
MPLYEYECDQCGNRFEAIRKFSDAPLTACPKCGGPVHKMQSAPAFQFKGSGWYVTDYAKKDQTTAKSDGVTKDAPSEKKEGAAEKTDAPAKTDKASADAAPPAKKD